MYAMGLKCAMAWDPCMNVADYRAGPPSSYPDPRGRRRPKRQAREAMMAKVDELRAWQEYLEARPVPHAFWFA